MNAIRYVRHNLVRWRNGDKCDCLKTAAFSPVADWRVSEQ